jgi:RsiW-degrading membrane proteinase PrsW (M82 family)
MGHVAKHSVLTEILSLCFLWFLPAYAIYRRQDSRKPPFRRVILAALFSAVPLILWLLVYNSPAIMKLFDQNQQTSSTPSSPGATPHEEEESKQ